MIENLGTRWRADQIELRGTGFLPDGRSEFLAVDLEPANRPEHRFIRLLIAADADHDGMPDDWESAIGLNPADPFDSMDDEDEDGDSNLAEFLHGTDPHNAADNTRRDEIPRAPRNAVVSNNADDTRDVDWEDVSDNEQFFAVYDTDSNGLTVELGRVGPNQTRFRLPTVTTTVSVRSGNGTGMSAATTALDLGQASNAGEGINHAIKASLRKPVISELRRLDLSRVKIDWTCEMPGVVPAALQYVKVVIFRQASDSNWQRIHTQGWAPSGTFEDTASITKIWRYSAITEYVNPSIGGALDAGSDAAPPRELDYGPATYGMLGYRGGLPSHSWSPPGHDLTGSAPRDDWFRTIAESFDGQSPSFIPTNPGLESADAPLRFWKQGDRYFPFNTTAPTELSTEGYVIRGKEFTIQALARVTPLYTHCLLELVPMASSPQPKAAGQIGSGTSVKDKYELIPTKIECLGTRFKAPAEMGFDDATYFASQHLPSGGGANGERPMKLLLRGSGTTPNLSKTGPFELGGSTNDGDGINFKLTTSNSTVDESGIVDESTTHRKLKVVTLPPKSWTVGLYAVDIVEADGTRHAGPNPPDAAALQAVLNQIFGQQANVTFNVTFIKRFTLNLAEITPPVVGYPASVDAMKAALWAGAAPQPDLALFWVAEFLPAGFGGTAFAYSSRGAVIKTTNLRTAAHEVGHCMGLFHCWDPQSASAQTRIADTEDKRLMGYGVGVLMRSKEIVAVNQWNALTVNPLGGQGQ